MFRKITLISINNSRQCFLHGCNITCFCPHLNRFRHSSRNIVHLQFLIKWIEKRIWNRLNRINGFQIYRKILISISKQEFRKSHRVYLHKINFTNRKWRRLWQSNPQQGTGACNMILRRIFTKVFHRINNFRAILYLVKNNKRFFRHYFLTTRQHQILQNSIYIFCGFKELFIFFIFIKVKICSILIILSAKLFQDPGLSHLTHPFQNQRFAIGRVFPV